MTYFDISGFNVERVQFGNFQLTFWDVGGQNKIRQLWYHYFANTDALIFVVDSADTTRMKEAADELRSLLIQDELRNIVVLVLANKQDLPNSLNTSQVAENMGLNQLKSHQWHIHGCCAQNGTGLYEALSELTTMINSTAASRKH